MQELGEGSLHLPSEQGVLPEQDIRFRDWHESHHLGEQVYHLQQPQDTAHTYADAVPEELWVDLDPLAEERDAHQEEDESCGVGHYPRAFKRLRYLPGQVQENI